MIRGRISDIDHDEHYTFRYSSIDIFYGDSHRPYASCPPGRADMGAYSASKAAVIRLAESASAELKGYGINVNCLPPGTMDTWDLWNSKSARLGQPGF